MQLSLFKVDFMEGEEQLHYQWKRNYYRAEIWFLKSINQVAPSYRHKWFEFSFIFLLIHSHFYVMIDDFFFRSILCTSHTCIKYFLFLNKIFLLIKKRKWKRFKDMYLSEKRFFWPNISHLKKLQNFPFWYNVSFIYLNSLIFSIVFKLLSFSLY